MREIFLQADLTRPPCRWMDVRRTIRLWLTGQALALLTLAGCAARLVAPPPSVVTPQFPDFVFPDVPPDLERSGLAPQMDVAWRWLQVGELGNAEKDFTTILKTSPTFYPAETGLGYLELARKDEEEALAHFDRALGQSRTYAAALVGRGEALLALRRDADALSTFEAALAADGSLELPTRRVEVLHFRLLQANLSNARQAAQAGLSQEAIVAYRQAIAASPESAFLYREIGAVERKTGNLDAALEHFEKATELEPNDASAWRDIGEILEARHDAPAAVEAYTRAMTLEPSAEIQSRVDTLREMLARALLPAEYREISQSPSLTRGELAALIGVPFEKLLEDIRPGAIVVTDTRGHWAAPWIFAVMRAGIMDAYPNHTFQPRSTVRRSDLAQAVSQLLTLMALQRPALAEKWKTPNPQFADVSPENLNYAAVSMAVESGVLPLLEGGTFQLSRPVTGAEAVAAIEHVEQLLP